MLTAAQIARYHENGYVIPDFRVSDATLEAIRSAHSRLIATYPEFADYCPALLPFDRGFAEFARDPAILDMVGQVIGDDIALWNSSFFAKPAKVGSRTPWHQDGEYWPMRPLATCTVWIAVDASTRENGCLRVIRGSHRDKTLRPHTTNDGPGLALNQELALTDVDESSIVDLELEEGQISLHDVFLVHGSEPNRSDKPRRGMTLRFMPTSSYYDREIERRQNESIKDPRAEQPHLRQMQRRPLFLMRGVDHCGRNEFEATSAAGAR